MKIDWNFWHIFYLPKIVIDKDIGILQMFTMNLDMFWHNSITIVEPQRWQQLMISLNSRIVKHQLLVRFLPWTADVFVFTYPVYLVVLYLWGVYKKDDYFKLAAFAIAFSAWLAAVTNQVIQYFGDKSRPEQAISLKENLILSHLPTDPFPSDHAAVSAAIAMSTLLWGIKHKDKKFLAASVFFWFASGVMSFSRVAVAIHRPTDILVGILVWVSSASLLLHSTIWKWVARIIGSLIVLEKRLFKNVFGINQ